MTETTIDRLTAARFDGPQALYTEAVRLLSERPALPDDLAGLVARLRDGCNLQQRDGERAADAIEALAAESARLASSEPKCAVVKPLVWVDDPDPSKGLTRADGYDIWDFDDGPCLVCNSVVNGSFETIDAAKAAAQADHEARILSAITLRTEAEVHAEAWAAAIEAAASITDRESYSNNPYVSMRMTDASRAIRALTQSADISAALDRIKAEARKEGVRIGAAREKMRALTEWLNEDEDNGELLMASLDGETIETLRAILASIQEVRK